jgi:uncharacterized protein (TIGR00299 family) protein
MDKTLYLECYYGISGDMTVAALLDLGANYEKLVEILNALNLNDEFSIFVSKVKKCGIDANDFNVILNTPEPTHQHRNLKDIFEIIDKVDNENVKQLSKAIFRIVAEAEAKAHGIAIDEVHFHEVGATDSIVDIVSTAFCLVDLKIDNVIVSPLYEGYGFVKCAHGMLPVPTPAVLNIINKYNLELSITDNDGEMVTPTGAAIVAAIKTTDRLPKEYTIKNIGLGAGKRYPDKPNILRAMIIQ